MKIHLRMVGCRVNQAEIEALARRFQHRGHEIVADSPLADYIIVNTCVVTQNAAKDSRKLIRELHRANPQAAIIVTGCYAQIAPDELAALPGVARVINNIGKDTLVEQLMGVPTEPVGNEPIPRNLLSGAAGRTRAFVKVQDGCDNRCAFCITTIARGVGRSRAQTDILDEISDLRRCGFQEVVLTGVHLGSYGHDQSDRSGLIELVQAVLAETDIPRFRLSSVEPWDLAADFFDLWKNPRLCRHLHLPLQSGCDATLKRMLRRTTQAEYRLLVHAARERFPDFSVTTDVMVGFPGETDEEFAISEAFIAEMAFARLHVFRYSPRPGTLAARMKNQVDPVVKEARSARLHTLSAQLAQQFAEKFVGQTRPVLWEQVLGAAEDGFIQVGYTDNYFRVRGVYPGVLTNQITAALLLHYDTIQEQIAAKPVIVAEYSI